MRVVLDANVLISARLSPLGASARLLGAFTDGRFELVLSPGLLDELAGVLAREKFRRWLTEQEAIAFIAALRAQATIVQDPPATPGTTVDPDDDYLIALAHAAGADYLISGDQHLTRLTNPRPPVLTPRALLQQLDQSQPQ